MSKLAPPAKLHVRLAPHIGAKDLLGYETALAIGGLLTRGEQAGEYTVEIFDAEKLRQHRNALPHWERSGVCQSWWIEGEENFHQPSPEGR
jgi:hypothetical protein